MSRVALFGKLPAHGDFVSRGLDPVERDRLDHWLSDAMTHARGVHGEAFEDRFDRAGPWRFAIARGGGWAAGALAMSADAAGRRFPLYGERFGLAPGDRAAAIAERVEAVLYRAIAEGLGIEATMAVLAQNDGGGDEDGTIAPGGSFGWRDATGVVACTEERPTDIVTRILTKSEAGVWA